MAHASQPRILAGQRVLVTGANSGIGEAVAIGLGRAGADVAVNFVAGEDAAKKVVTAIETEGSKAIAVKADVSKEAEVQGMFKTMFDAFGTIDILVAKPSYADGDPGPGAGAAPYPVNSIGPGAIRTPINTQAWETPAAYDDLMRLIPYKRIGEPADIAQVAVSLAADLADYVTGQTIFVDGGMTCYPEFATGG